MPNKFAALVDDSDRETDEEQEQEEEEVVEAAPVEQVTADVRKKGKKQADTCRSAAVEETTAHVTEVREEKQPKEKKPKEKTAKPKAVANSKNKFAALMGDDS